jgi:peptidoglycan/LPS O-acetylase OafA/YrhL
MRVQFESNKGNAPGVMPSAEIRRVVSGHMPALDGLRGIAILLVLIFHFSWAPGVFAGLSQRLLFGITGSGWTGVELFFVLSGFLITGILLDSKGAENYFSSFYLRRALRILPLSYAALFVGFILCPLLGKLGLPFLPKEFSTAQLWYWFYLGNWAWLRGQDIGYFYHFWSLAVEEQFYLVWPCVIFMTSRRTLAKICIALALVAPILRILLYIKGVDGFIFTTSHLDALGLGALAALIARDENWVRLLIPRLNYLIYPGLVIFCLLGVANRSFSSDGPAFVFGALPLAIFFTGLLLRAVATTGSRSRLQQFLQVGWLRSCGKYSYAMYVIHYPLIAGPYRDIVQPYLMRYIHRPPLWDWFHHPSILGGAILLTLVIVHILAPCLFFFGVGKFSWWAFEGPINNLKRHFKPRWRSSIPRDTEVESCPDRRC